MDQLAQGNAREMFSVALSLHDIWLSQCFFIGYQQICLVAKPADWDTTSKNWTLSKKSPGPSRSCTTAADGAEPNSKKVRPCVNFEVDNGGQMSALR